MDPNATFDLIRHRRSIKPDKMKPTPIDRAIVERMLECATWAPTHGMTEPWRFIVFSGEARRALAEAVVSTMAPEDRATLDPGDPRREEILRKMTTPPVTIAIACAPSLSPKIVEHEEIAATAIAVQNMMLYARSHGLATYWSSGKKAFHPRMAKFLRLESPDRCLGFLYVGWPAVEWPEGVRRPASEKVTWRE